MVGAHFRYEKTGVGIDSQCGQRQADLIIERTDRADYIIDIGPKAGRLGGEVVYQGDVANLNKKSDSYTVNILREKKK